MTTPTTQSEPQTQAQGPSPKTHAISTRLLQRKKTTLRRTLAITLIYASAATIYANAATGTPPPTTPLTRPFNPHPVWTPTGKVSPASLREASGLVESRRYPGVFWTHGDSGNDPKLVAIDTNGAVLAEVMVEGAPNTDWEDICADDQGRLYIGDIGNSAGMFPVRYIYRLDEPDPHNPPSQPITATRYLRFKYPDAQRLNLESLFWHAGSLYVLPRGLAPTIIYRIEPTHGSNAQLLPVASLPLAGATSADASLKGNRLAIFTKTATWVFPLTGDDRFIDISGVHHVSYPIQGVVEGGCFGGEDLRLITEAGDIFHITPNQLAQQVRFKRQ